MAEGCGSCLYGKGINKEKNHISCMLDNYENKALTFRCERYKRDFKKSLVTVIHKPEVK